MSSKFSHMDLLNQYFHKMRDHIQELELENTNLKKSQNGEIDKLKKEFASLTERHKELKEAFLESEKQVKELTQEKEQILQKEKELSELIKSQFEEKFDAQQFLTPKKPTSNMENESQKVKYLKAKKVPRKLELKNMYESESESDDSKVNFDNLFHMEDKKSDDEGINVMKKLIGNDLWNCMESSINPGPQHYQHKSSQTKVNQNEELGLLSNMFGTYLATLDPQAKASFNKVKSPGENVDFLRGQFNGNKK